MFARLVSVRCFAVLKTLSITSFMLAAIGISNANAQLETGWKTHDLKRPLPAVATPADQALTIKPPSDADVLFDGTDLSKWRDSQGGKSKWKIDGKELVVEPKSGSIYTKKKYGDCQLHLEWLIPTGLKPKGRGQFQGNSGVYLMDAFEIQILDTHTNKTYADGMAGAIYGQYPPLVNATRAAGKWQSYDVVFHRPHFNEDGSIKSRARITVLHNGVLVQDNSEILGPTSWLKHLDYDKSHLKGSLALQDHRSPVRFRNIWIRELTVARPRPEKPYSEPKVDLSTEDVERLLGDYGDFKITKSGEMLYCQLFQVKMELVPLSKSEFSMKKCAGKLSFDFDEKGQVKEAILRMDAAGKRVGTQKAATAK